MVSGIYRCARNRVPRAHGPKCVWREHGGFFSDGVVLSLELFPFPSTVCQCDGCQLSSLWVELIAGLCDLLAMGAVSI